MKRLALLVFILMVLLVFSACNKKTQEVPEVSSVPITTRDSSSTEDEADEQDGISKVKIGFCLAGEGAFYEQLILDIEKECKALNYEPQIKTSSSTDKQIADINSMLSIGVEVLIIDPVDVDSLEAVLAECETQNVPVINIMNSINGLVSTLISPDYLQIGRIAGQKAADFLSDAGGGCMMLQTDYDDFNAQLLTDGFKAKIDEYEKIQLISSQYCGNDEEQAYVSTKAELKSINNEIDFIFAQSDLLAKGALRAIKEEQQDVRLVVFGADMQIIESVISGDIFAAIFFGPGELAESSIYFADKFVNRKTFQPPQFNELLINVAEIETASEYLVEDALYAQTKE